MKNERWKRAASFEKLLFRGSDKLVGSLPRHTLSPPPRRRRRRRVTAAVGLLLNQIQRCPILYVRLAVPVIIYSPHTSMQSNMTGNRNLANDRTRE